MKSAVERRIAARVSIRRSSPTREVLGPLGWKKPIVTRALGSTARMDARILSIQWTRFSSIMRFLSLAEAMSYVLPLADVTLPDLSENGGYLSVKYSSLRSS